MAKLKSSNTPILIYVDGIIQSLALGAKAGAWPASRAEAILALLKASLVPSNEKAVASIEIAMASIAKRSARKRR